MYLGYFNLHKLPFSLTADVDQFVGLQSQLLASQRVLHALQSGDAFMVVSGEVGTGKTMLLHKLAAELSQDPGWKLVQIANPVLSHQGLIRLLGRQLGADAQLPADLLLDQLTTKLLSLHASGQRLALLIDEAQALPADTLEALRLLGNLETQQQKLIQVVLFGQPELEQLLNEHRFRQLKQRIVWQHRLQPMNREQEQSYVRQRLQASGYQGPPLFDAASLRHLHQYSQGIPRLTNILAHKALLSAMASQQHQVKTAQVQAAAVDSQLSQSQGYGLLLLTLVGLSCLIGLGLWLSL